MTKAIRERHGHHDTGRRVKHRPIFALWWGSACPRNFSGVDSDPAAHYEYIVGQLDKRGLAYLHMVEQAPGAETDARQGDILKRLRAKWTGFYIVNGGYDGDTAAKAVAEGHADAVAFGRLFIANPDLPRRLRLSAPLNEGDSGSFYGGGAEGYIDYPFLEKAA